MSEDLNALFLFNSKGKHIATYYEGGLFSPKGKNIGVFLREEKIFVDMNGKYIGGVTKDNRLLANTFSEHYGKNFGPQPERKNIGALKDSTGQKSVGLAKGFKDIKTPWLKK